LGLPLKKALKKYKDCFQKNNRNDKEKGKTKLFHSHFSQRYKKTRKGQAFVKNSNFLASFSLNGIKTLHQNIRAPHSFLF
jgi:hypothetical protein